MPTSHKSLMFLLVVLLLFTTSCGSAGGNPLLGVWKLDPLQQSGCTFGSDLEFLKDSWVLFNDRAFQYILVEGNRVLVKYPLSVGGHEGGYGFNGGSVIGYKYIVSGNKLTLGSCTYTRR